VHTHGWQVVPLGGSMEAHIAASSSTARHWGSAGTSRGVLRRRPAPRATACPAGATAGGAA
jgi:hypothetical protein